MPELPEVETVVHRLRVLLVGRVFRGAQVEWPPMVGPSPAELAEHLPGQHIRAVDRRAKYIVMSLSEGYSLLVHLKMSGDLYLASEFDASHPHDRVVFFLDDGDQLRFNDQRKFGRVHLTQNQSQVLGKLGPEPLSPEFSEANFLSLFEGRSAKIKPLLMDQSFLAGIGNIYAAEILFAAGIHPERRADTLQDGEKTRLFWAVKQVLTLAIQNEGSSLADDVYKGGRHQDHFHVYGREDQPCPLCGALTNRVKLGQRSTYFCVDCQQ